MILLAFMAAFAVAAMAEDGRRFCASIKISPLNAPTYFGAAQVQYQEANPFSSQMLIAEIVLDADLDYFKDYRGDWAFVSLIGNRLVISHNKIVVEVLPADQEARDFWRNRMYRVIALTFHRISISRNGDHLDLTVE